MRIFKYIFKMSMLNTLISFLVIIGLVWVSQSFRSIKFIFEKGGTIIDFFQLSIFSMPAWLSISVSFGFFFGVFITFTKFENDRELIAMKSSGLNALQLSYPIFVIGIILSSFLFLNFHFLLPNSYSFYKNYEDNLRYKKPTILFNENSFYHIDKKTFFAQTINGNELKKLFIKDYSSKKKTVDIFANKALFIPGENNIRIKLIDGVKSDIKFTPYETIDQLLNYCHKVAGVVGIMFCEILGIDDNNALIKANDLGIAMQLTNIMRDIFEDANMGRVYLPHEFFGRINPYDIIIQNKDVVDNIYSEKLDQIYNIAETKYSSGISGLKFLNYNHKFIVYISAIMYREIGNKIIKNKETYSSGKRSYVSFIKKIELIIKCFFQILLWKIKILK